LAELARLSGRARAKTARCWLFYPGSPSARDPGHPFIFGKPDAGHPATCLDRKDDLLGLAGFVVVEVEAVVDAAVGSLALIYGPRADLTESPPLELVFVFGGEGGGSGVVGGFANDFVGLFDFGAVAIGEALLDEADGEVGDINANPAAIKALGGLDGGAATTEGIKDEVSLVGAGFEDAFEEGFGLLGGVAEAFLGLGIDWENVGPYISEEYTRGCVEEPF
jgi:hypothetical protein